MGPTKEEQRLFQAFGWLRLSLGTSPNPSFRFFMIIYKHITGLFTAEISFSVMIEVVLVRPVFILNWSEDGAIAKSEDVAWKILLGLYPPGDEHLVLGAHTHQPFVKRPMA
jgi:hypothetical protein